MTDTDFSDLTEADLADALEGNTPPAEPEPQAPEGDGQEQQQRQPAENPFPRSDDRPRDEQGRFKAKDEAPPADEGKEGDEGKQAGEGEGERREPPLKEWQPLWWKDDQHGEWAKMPEALRQKLEERERESAQAITEHSTKAKEWKPINDILEPHAEELKQAGVSKQDYIANLIQWDKNFREDPVSSAMQLLSNVGIDPQKLAEHMATANEGGQANDPRVTQELQALRQEVAALKSGRTDETRQQEFQRIAEWAKDKPYFDELKPYMASIAKAEGLTGTDAATLDKLYESAQYAHPTLRTRILSDQRKKEADRARQAGVSTRGAPRGSPSPNARLSLDEELSANYDEVYGGAV